MSQFSTSVFAYAVFSRWGIPIPLVLPSAAVLLVICIGIVALCKAIGRRAYVAGMQAAQRLLEKEQARQANLREEQRKTFVDQLNQLAHYCDELRCLLCGTTVYEESDLRWFYEETDQPYSPPEPTLRFRSIDAELSSLEKAMWWLASSDPAMDGQAVADFFWKWYHELKARYLQQSKPAVFPPYTVLALQDEARRIWKDVVALTLDSRKDFLLECLQHSVVQAGIALAQVGPALAKGGSDAQWIAAGWYRTHLIHSASSAALKLVLRTRREGIDLADTQLVETYARAFAQALTSKCAEDEQALYQELLHAQTRAAVARCTVYHATDPWAMLVPSPDNWLLDRERQFRCVAKVDVPLGTPLQVVLEDVFTLTNHRDDDRPWTSNPEVLWHDEGEVRSTSAGDVIVVDGRAWMVMAQGWKEIVPSPLPAALRA